MVSGFSSPWGEPMRVELRTLARVVAALRHVQEAKETCRGRYDTEGRQWCTCEKNELCQIRLTEVLNHRSKANMVKFSAHAQALAEAGVLNIRKSNAPPGKPSKFYSLPDDWEARFMAFVRAAVAWEERRIVRDNGFALGRTEDFGEVTGRG